MTGACELHARAGRHHARLRLQQIWQAWRARVWAQIEGLARAEQHGRQKCVRGAWAAWACWTRAQRQRVADSGRAWRNVLLARCWRSWRAQACHQCKVQEISARLQGAQRRRQAQMCALVLREHLHEQDGGRAAASTCSTRLLLRLLIRWQRCASCTRRLSQQREQLTAACSQRQQAAALGAWRQAMLSTSAAQSQHDLVTIGRQRLLLRRALRAWRVSAVPTDQVSQRMCDSHVVCDLRLHRLFSRS